MSMRDYKFTLAAGQERSLNVQGNWFHVLDAVGVVGIRFDEGSLIERSQGQGGSRTYSRVLVSSPIAQTVTLSLGVGRETDARATVNANISTTIEGGNDNAHKPNVTVTAGNAVQLLPANNNRKSIRVSLASTEAGSIMLGKSGITANNGGLLEVGDTDYIDTEGALYAFNPNADDVVVWVMEINRI